MDLAHFEAAMNGNVDMFPFADPNKLDDILSKVSPSGNSLLHVAASSDQVKMTQLIAGHRPSLISKTNSEGHTALHVAARAGRLNTAKTLIEYAKEANTVNLLRMTNHQGNTALHEALIGLREYSMLGIKNKASQQHEEFVALNRCLVMEDPVASYIQNVAGKSPLCLAVECGSKDFLEFLLKNLPEYPGSSDHGPLGNNLVQLIVNPKNFHLLKVIREQKQELLFIQDGEGNTPLHYAASMGHHGAVRYLLNLRTAGALTRNNEGLYPLHVACENGNIGVVKELLRKWPYPTEFLCKKGQTILHVAAKYGKEKVVRYILKQKYSEKLINKMDEDGNTALHLATSLGYHLVVATLLLNNRSVSDIVNNDGQTSYDIAEMKYIDWVSNDGKKDKKAPGNVPEQPLGLTSNNDGESSGKKQPKSPISQVCPEQPKEPDLLETNMIFSIFFLRLYWRRLTRRNGLLSNKGSRSIRDIRYKRKRLGKEDIKERINSLLVVSTIIVAATFGASHQVPQSDDHRDDSSLGYYLLYSNIAMSFSIVATLALCWTQLVDTKLAYLVVLAVSSMLAVALLFMWLACTCALDITINDFTTRWYVELNNDIALSAVSFISLISLPLILPFMYQWMDFATTIGYFLLFLFYYILYRIVGCIISAVSSLKYRICDCMYPVTI